MQTSPHVTQVSHEMPKFARYCVRLLKQEKAEMLWESFCLSGENRDEGLVAGAGFEPATSGL